MTTEPSLILFDCDGTLVDSHAAIVHAMQSAFDAAGAAVPGADEVRQVIGLSLSEAVHRLAERSDVVADVMAGYREHYVAAEGGLELFPGVCDTLAELRRRGYWLGVVTGKSRPGLLRVLEQFDLADDFLVLRTADCCPSKPHPAMVMECMQEMGVPAERTSVVGDAGFDMQMALSAGVKALGVSFGVADRETLLDSGAADVVDVFADLLPWFPCLKAEQPSATIVA